MTFGEFTGPPFKSLAWLVFLALTYCSVEMIHMAVSCYDQDTVGFISRAGLWQNNSPLPDQSIPSRIHGTVIARTTWFSFGTPQADRVSQEKEDLLYEWRAVRMTSGMACCTSYILTEPWTELIAVLRQAQPQGFVVWSSNTTKHTINKVYSERKYPHG